MKEFEWIKEFPAAITVSDLDGNVVAMNDKAEKTFEKWGGRSLIGQSLYDCHNPKSTEMIKAMMKDNFNNAYTIEKQGIKKMIYQSPWYKDGQVAGMVEISIEIPFEMPHFIRG